VRGLTFTTLLAGKKVQKMNGKRKNGYKGGESGAQLGKLRLLIQRLSHLKTGEKLRGEKICTEEGGV